MNSKNVYLFKIADKDRIPAKSDCHACTLPGTGTHTCKSEIGITDHLFNIQIFETDELCKFATNLIQNAFLYIQGMKPFPIYKIRFILRRR